MTLVDQMRATFARWEASGLSLLAFGKREGISYAKLQYWRRRFREQEPRDDSSRIEGAPERASFVPVSVVPDPEPNTSKPIEVWLMNGVSLEVPTGFDEHELRRLVSVLSTC